MEQDDIRARLRAAVDALMPDIDPNADYEAFMKRYEAMTADERVASEYFAETVASAYEKARASRDDVR